MEKSTSLSAEEIINAQAFWFCLAEGAQGALEEKATVFPGHSANKGSHSSISGLTDTKIKAQFGQG